MNWIGIDLGGTKIQGIVFDGEKAVHAAKRKTPTCGGPLEVVDAVAAVIKELDVDDVAAVGVGAPGVVDGGSGVVRRAPNLPGWHEPFDLGSALSKAIDGVPVVVDNDVNVGTLAEHRLGAARSERDVLGVFVGTGVGGAVIIDGALRRGPTGLAGEIGHLVIEGKGRRCGCGRRGHVEAYAGRAGMERRARSLAEKGRDTVLVELAPAKRMTSSVFAKALAAKDAVAEELIDESISALGYGIASAIALLDMPFVVVGGGLADRLGPEFVAAVQKAVRKELFVDDIKPEVIPATLGDEGGALGAALVAKESQEDDGEASST